MHSHTKMRATIAALFALAVGATSCSSESSNSAPETTQPTTQGSESPGGTSDEQGQWPRTVDSLVVQDGKATKETEKITIEKKPERIVSTSVTVTGSLLAIDAPVVATGGAQPGPAATDDGFFNQWADVAEERNVKSLYHLEPSFEKILAESPDLIFVSAAGADSATKIYDQLKGIGVPVIVVDYSNQSWEELVTELGAATGHENNAKETLADFDKRVSEVKNNINLPPQPTNIGLALPEGEGLNFWTTQSAQGALLTELGFEVIEPDASVVDTESQFAKRNDVKHVAPENLDKAINGNTFLVTNVDGVNNPVDAITSNPQLADTTAVKNKHVYKINPEVFRIDFYSASKLLDQIEQQFKK